MHIMGIDIGTTSISLVLVEKESGNLIARETADHQSFLKSDSPEGKIQDPERIYRITREKIEKLNHTYGIPVGIGVTGQMHGMLYVDEEYCILCICDYSDRILCLPAGRRRAYQKAGTGRR